MAQSNANPLLRSWLVVILFWWTVLFFITDAGFDQYAPSLGRAIFVVLVGLICGAAIHLIYHFWKIGNALWFINGETRHGAVVTLGRLPEAPDLLPKQPRRWWPFGRKASTPSDFLPWFGLYESRHPDYAVAFRAVFDALAASPDHPATVAERGHADLSLFKHSLGVVEAMMDVAPSWQYYGRRKRNGEIVIPLSDPNLPFHSFAADDPLLPLAALAHDIGKLMSYQRGEDGQFIEIRPTHGPEGAKILRGMPAVRQIPFADWTALLFAVELYHHPGQMPQSAWITDRMRSLTELLLHADIEASRREGRIPGPAASAPAPPPSDPPVAEPDGSPIQPPEPSTPPSESCPVPAAVTPPQASPNDEEVVDAPSPPAVPPPSIAEQTLTDEAGDDNGPDPIDLAADVLNKPDRINGRKNKERIAFKHGEWLYLDEELLRLSISEATNSNQYLTSKAPGVPKIHSYTQALLEQLHAKGLLRCPAGAFSAEAALYRTRSQVDGKSPKERDAVIIVRTDAFPWTKNIPDCKACPQVIEASPLPVAAPPQCDTVAVSTDTIASDTNSEADDPVNTEIYRVICQGILSNDIPHRTETVGGEKCAVFSALNLPRIAPGYDHANPPKRIRIILNTNNIEQAVLPYPTPEDAGFKA